MSNVSSPGNKNVCNLQKYVLYTHPSKGFLTEKADVAAAFNFSMNEVCENITDQ